MTETKNKNKCIAHSENTKGFQYYIRVGDKKLPMLNEVFIR